MIQSRGELEDWYSQADPWGYYDNPQDAVRRERILAAIPKLDYTNVLDIGCGNGFVTKDLPGKRITGLDISERAVQRANEHAEPKILYRQGSLFDIPELGLPAMDLIVINGVLYPQYIGESHRLIYILIERLLRPGGILLSSHIYEWYKMRFPYITLSREYFPYREYSQVLEVYCK